MIKDLIELNTSKPDLFSVSDKKDISILEGHY